MINSKTQLIASRLLQSPTAAAQLKKLWTQLNGNATITTHIRNQLKISSIARFVIGQARTSAIDPSKVVDVIRGLKGQRCPKAYIEELRKFLPELSDPLLHLKSTSEIDSTFRKAVA
jgi:hypothetical protein